MVKHHDIPRTLRGVGGIRLIDHPGVHYPRHILNVPPGMNKRTGLPYELPPEGSVSSAEAARLLGVSLATVRGLLRRRGVNFCIVKNSTGQLSVYWRRSEILDYEGSLPPLRQTIPPGMLETREALQLLGVGRSSLYRYVQSRKLRQYRFRINTRRGLRVKLLYSRAEVRHLGDHMRAMRAYQSELAEHHRQYMQHHCDSTHHTRLDNAEPRECRIKNADCRMR